MEFTVNAERRDPYKNYRFLVRWDGKTVAGVSKVGGLSWSSDPVTHRDGGDPTRERKSPGMITFESITLERGLTHDPEFEIWASKVWNFEYGEGRVGNENSQTTSLADFRKAIEIVLLNEAGQPAKAWRVYRCWVSSFNSMPELDASSAGVAIESLTIEHEGWERDTSVTEPTEPSYEPTV